jgi:hypothetical protein
MGFRYFVLAAALVVFGAGCTSKASPPPAPVSAETVARVHWLGKKRLAAETNAAYFLGLWNLPESAKLEAQTLDKLSVAPWRVSTGDTLGTNAASSRLRPMLDDLVQEESYLEIRHGTNQMVGEAVFAIRLGAERSVFWETNLAAVVESLTGLRATAPQAQHRGWSLKKHDAPNLIEFTRVGDWGIIGLAHDKNDLLADMMARLNRDGRPWRDTNAWLDLSVDFDRLRRALPTHRPALLEFPKVTLNVTGDGENVVSRGELKFARPLALELESWIIPTNLIHEPLLSLTAVRGIRSWLASRDFWKDFTIETPPNQFYYWTLQGSPAQAYFAFPVSNASNAVAGLSGYLTEKLHPRISTNNWGKIEPAKDFAGIVWTGIPFVAPFLRADKLAEGEFISGGLFPMAPTNPPPPELIEHLVNSTNLVLYDWEITGPRTEGWLYVGQLFRLISGKAQLPPASSGMLWLKALIPKLGNCVTEIRKTGPSEIAFVRRSGIGLSSTELHALADWLESPQYPNGLHSFLAPPDIPAQTNAPVTSQPQPN